MTSEKQLQANRRNAARSTGPRTPAGKAASRLNAVTHGLLSQVVLIADDSEQDLLAALREQLGDDLQPVGSLEEFLVDRVVSAMWRLRRALRVEAALMQENADTAGIEEPLDLDPNIGPFFGSEDEDDEKEKRPKRRRRQVQKDPHLRLCALLGTYSVERVMRYEKEIERQLYRALAELQKLQAARRQQAENEVEPSPAETAQSEAPPAAEGEGRVASPGPPAGSSMNGLAPRPAPGAAPDGPAPQGASP